MLNRIQDKEYRCEYGAESAKYELARVIAQARKDQGMTQEELARLLGVSQAYVAKVESGQANPTIGHAAAMLATIWLRLRFQLEPLVQPRRMEPLPVHSRTPSGLEDKLTDAAFTVAGAGDSRLPSVHSTTSWLRRHQEGKQMHLPDSYRVRLADEVQLALKLMEAERDPLSQLYFFSATFGEAGRILNYHWDAKLVLLHTILQVVYSSANNRIQSMASNREPGIMLPDGFMESVMRTTADLERAIRENLDEELDRVISHLAELSYLTSGNGYYLYRKRAVTI
jgi:transcriptional regulator with XRE-family HTH domain